MQTEKETVIQPVKAWSKQAEKESVIQPVHESMWLIHKLKKETVTQRVRALSEVSWVKYIAATVNL